MMLSAGLIGVQDHQLPIFVAMIRFQKGCGIFPCSELLIGIFVQAKPLGTVIEFLVRNHPILHKELQLIPFFPERILLVFGNIR